MSSIPATYLIDPEGTVVRLDLRGKSARRDAEPADQAAGASGRQRDDEPVNPYDLG